MKKTLSLILVTAMLLSLCMVLPASALRPRGDINNDGKVDTVDYIMLKRVVIGTFTPNAIQQLACDVNNDGKVDTVDYIMLKRAVIGTYKLEGYLDEDDGNVIPNASPAIGADVGTTLKLSDYTVVFDGDTTASKVTAWLNGEDEISEFKPTKAGVTALTAKNGDKTKTIYVVAKNANDTEYVLFEDDFSGYSSTADLTAAGYKKINGDMELKNGMLEYGNNTGLYNEGRILLPEWLGDFGNYAISTEAKIVDNNGRWFGPVYRISNANGRYFPYYHICIRQNTTANGLEFGGRNVNDGWSVMYLSSGIIADMTKDFHSLNFVAYNDTFQFSLDGEEIFYTTQDDLAAIAKGDSSKPWVRIDKGYVGFIASGTKVLLKNVKVTLKADEIVRPEKQLQLLNINHDNSNVLNPVANVQTVSGKDAYKTAFADSAKPSSILVDASEVSDFADFFKACKTNVCIANIKAATNAQVDSLVSAANSVGFKDISLISSEASVLKYAREKLSVIRTGLEVTLANDKLSSKEAEAIRKAVRGAPATFCVISTEHATTYNVHDLQALALSVWVKADISNDTDVLKAVTSGANALVTTDSAKLTKTINSYFIANTMSRMPILIGHRGNPTQAPENSLLSFETAMKNGADVFEIDVEITKDGEIVVMHDNTIDRTSNGSGSVNNLTLAQIKQYKLKYTEGSKSGQLSDQEIPTLREVLELLKKYPNCRVFIEFKGSNANNIPVTSQIVKEMGMEDRVDVISFNSTFLSQTQQSANMPGMSTGLLASTSKASSNYEDALSNFYDSMRIAQLYNSTINNSGVSYKPYMTVANDRGFTVWPWTYALSGMNGAFFIGCAGITTNDVQWSKDMYKFLNVADIKVSANGTANISASATTFASGEKSISAGDLVVKVISGSDVVSVDKGTVKGLKAGTATILVGVSTKTASNATYVLYAQPVTVTVNG